MHSTPPRLLRYRCQVASRALAAMGGGYALAAVTASAGALGFQSLGLARADATMAATMLSFVVYTIAALWAFGCASATRAWAAMALPGMALALLTWALLPGASA